MLGLRYRMCIFSIAWYHDRSPWPCLSTQSFTHSLIRHKCSSRVRSGQSWVAPYRACFGIQHTSPVMWISNGNRQISTPLVICSNPFLISIAFPLIISSQHCQECLHSHGVVKLHIGEKNTLIQRYNGCILCAHLITLCVEMIVICG